MSGLLGESQALMFDPQKPIISICSGTLSLIFLDYLEMVWSSGKVMEA
jgi:hypothetical protein